MPFLLLHGEPDMPAKSTSVAIIPRHVVDLIKGAMKASPMKVKDQFLLKEAIAEMFPEIEAMVKKGYSYDEVAALFSENSVEVKGATLKKYCSELRRATVKAKAKPKKDEVQDSSAVVKPATAQVEETAQASVQRQIESALEPILGTTQSSKTRPVKQHSSSGNSSKGFVEMPDDL
jgi:hypothetical protein